MAIRVNYPFFSLRFHMSLLAVHPCACLSVDTSRVRNFSYLSFLVLERLCSVRCSDRAALRRSKRWESAAEKAGNTSVDVLSCIERHTSHQSFNVSRVNTRVVSNDG